jgi:steroid delta-isomerase-like uncharacterized protein
MDLARLLDYLAAWNAHDVDRLLTFFTDDGVYEDVALARVNKGKGEIRSFFEEAFLAFPDFHLKDDGATVLPDGKYVAEWTMSGTHDGDLPMLPATHKSFSVRGVSVGETSGDLITRNSDYWNMAEFLVHIGILPPMPTA